MKIDIIKTLEKIAKSEQEEFKAFRERVIEYCTKEKAVFNLLRALRGFEVELKDCLLKPFKVNVDSAVIKKVLKTIKTEVFILKTKLRHPNLMEILKPKSPLPLGEWTGDKLDLIELIYAIYKTKSVNNGNITLNAIQECIEFIFQVKLGNISNRIAELENRKHNDNLYLEILINNLNIFLDDKNK
jgi:hypothetical protein